MAAWVPYAVALLVFAGLAYGVVFNEVPTNELSLLGPTLPTSIQHVFLIMMENQQTKNIIPGQPYETQLANKYAWGGNNYFAICHPSTGNYMAISSGQPLHCGSDGYATYPANNLFNLLQTKNVPWVAYAESMVTPCQTTNVGNYAVRHNPPPYFTDIASVCAAKDLPIASLVNDYPFSTVPPAFTYIAPNLIDDAHSSSAAVGDAWLSSFVPKLMAQSWFSSTVIFITYDESGSPELNTGPGGGPVPFIAVSPYTVGIGALSSTNSHYNALSTFEWLLGLPCTGSGNDCTSTPMKALFNFGGGGGNGGVTATLSVTPSTVTVGSSVTYSASGSGGTAPYSYAYVGLPSGCTSQSTTSLSCTPESAGTYQTTVTVTDANGNSGTASATLRVNSVGTSLSLTSLTATPSTVAVNDSYTVSAVVSGGATPYTYSWSNVPSGCTASGRQWTCTATTPGTFSIGLTVTDSNGNSVSGTVTVTVTQGPTNGGGGGGFPALTEAQIVGLVASAGIAAGILVAWAARRPEWGAAIAIVSGIVLFAL